MSRAISQLEPQPWWDEIERLYCQGMGASDIAAKLDKPVPLICQIMGRPDFKNRLMVRQKKIDLVFVERLLDLWDLSETMVKVADRTAKQYLKKLAEKAPEKEIKDLRRDALAAAKDILDRIGLRAPEKVDIRQHSIIEDATPLETFERRLEVIREYKELGVPIPEGLSKVDLDG